MKKINTITIGDLHGRNDWLNFEDLSDLLNNPKLTPKFDYYIFLGDYVDSFSKTDKEIRDNLNNLIKLKTNYPDNIILLLGNHDIQYVYIENKLYLCSGFRPQTFMSLNTIFKNNKDKFQLAFQLDNYLWTHAGVHEGWYMHEYSFTDLPLADSLNGAFQKGEKSLFDIGRLRGGFKDVGGPLWLDKKLSSKKPLSNYHQIVGHTPIDDIQTITINDTTSITYCDCIEHGNGNYYKLEINI